MDKIDKQLARLIKIKRERTQINKIRNEEIEAEINEEDEDVYEDLSNDEADFLEEIPDEEE